MFDDLNDLYQQVILDHSRSPRNFGVLPSPTSQARGHNPVCGDNLVLYLAMDGDRVKEVSFTGDGCAISKASASLLTEAIKGRTRAEIQGMFDKVHVLMTKGGAADASLGKLAVFAGVHKFPARVKCGILPWHAALAALEGKAAPVSTENDTTASS